MVFVKLRCRGKQEVDENGNPMFTEEGYPVITPDLPDHRFEWRVCSYNEITNEFTLYAKVDRRDLDKILDFVDEKFIDETIQKLNEAKTLKQLLK